MDAKKRCPYCAEEIRAEAVRCPLCRSRLAGFDLEHWHRGHDDARVAGVAAAVGHALSLPVGLVRLAFVLATVIHFLGATLYALLWLVIPPAPGEKSVLERGLQRAQAGARALAGERRPPSSHASAADVQAEPGPVGDDSCHVSPGGARVIHNGGDGER